MSNFDADADFIEARFSAGENQYDLELFAAAPEAMDTGTSDNVSDSSGGDSFAINPIIIEPTGGGQQGGYAPCPRIDQYTLVRSDSGEIVPRIVSMIKRGDFLFNPVTKNFDEVLEARIARRQKCFYIRASKGAETVVSLNHPIICRFNDKTGMPVNEIKKGQQIVVSRNTKAFLDTALEITPAAAADVMKISLKTGFIYATGLHPSKMILGHNAKPIFENYQN